MIVFCVLIKEIYLCLLIWIFIMLILLSIMSTVTSKRLNLSLSEDPTGIYKGIPLSEEEKLKQQTLVEKFQKELENPSVLLVAL